MYVTKYPRNKNLCEQKVPELLVLLGEYIMVALYRSVTGFSEQFESPAW